MRINSKKKYEFSEILSKAVEKHILSLEEIIFLLGAEGDKLKELYQSADRVRAKYLGDIVHLRGIIEFSNFCQCNCKYCGLRRDNFNLKRYRLSPDEIVEMAVQAGELGYKTLVLQSGEDSFYNRNRLGWIIEEIKNKADMAITLSVGERSYTDYKYWRKKGADRYLLRHETADPDLYDELHPGVNLKDRIQRLKWLKDLNYQVGSGNIIGLPGQTKEIIARDIMLFKELDLEMVGLGPLISNSHTPLKDIPKGNIEMTLKTIAITRLLLPLAHIPGTTALASIDPEGREKSLQSGANVIMPNVTKGESRLLYELYPNKAGVEEEPGNYRWRVEKIITSLGRKVGTDYGHSPKMVAG